MCFVDIFMTLPIGLNFDDNFFYRNGANSFLQRLFASSQIAFSYHNTNRTKTSHVALFRHNFATNDTFVCRSCHPPTPSASHLSVHCTLKWDCNFYHCCKSNFPYLWFPMESIFMWTKSQVPVEIEGWVRAAIPMHLNAEGCRLSAEAQ